MPGNFTPVLIENAGTRRAQTEVIGAIEVTGAGFGVRLNVEAEGFGCFLAMIERGALRTVTFTDSRHAIGVSRRNSTRARPRAGIGRCLPR